MAKLTDPDLHSTQHSLPIAMMRAREKLMGPIRDMLSDVGLTEQQWRILRVLDEFGPLDVTHLAERACLLLPSLSRILRGMEDKALISRTAHETDRRRQLVAIAPEGKTLIQANADRARSIAQDVEERLGGDKLRQLLSLLDDVERL